MNKRKKKYTFFQKATSVFLMLTLLWLTVSTPFVIVAQQELAKHQSALSLATAQTDCGDYPDEDSSGSNTIEEKVPGSVNLAEEFLHDHHISHHFFSVISLYHKLENADSYTAFHGELLVPPPNIS